MCMLRSRGVGTSVNMWSHSLRSWVGACVGSTWVFMSPTQQHRLFPCLLCFGSSYAEFFSLVWQIVFSPLAPQSKRCPGYLQMHRFCSVRSAFLCAVNSLFCINFQMSLLISSSSNFCHCTLQISPLPVTICSIRSGYFSLCFVFSVLYWQRCAKSL